MKRPRSFRRMLFLSNVVVIAVVVVVFAASFIYNTSVVSQYRALIENVNRANTLSMSVSTDIDQLAYELVAGKVTPESSRWQELFEGLRAQLGEIEESSPYGENLYLIEVARRTMATAEDYVERITENVRTDAPVAQNEALLEDIRQVSDLLEEVVQDFTEYEIRISEEKNDRLQTTYVMMNGMQVAVFAAALVFLYANNLSVERGVSRPLEDMRAMAGRIARGDFDVRIDPAPVSELNELAQSMNSMAARLDSLMKANIEKQKNLRRAEQQILQAQISPHFLYNTLDTIVALAESEQIEDVVTTTIALSNFHRASLSKGQDWVPVAHETEQIESYLTIQKMRYGVLLDYEIDIDSDIMGEYMVKILLQPLVENAIYHGVKLSRKGGKVTITGRRADGALVFTVENTPPGMQKDRLEALVKDLREDAPARLEKPGYGLFNVSRRIRIFYETDDGLSIESSPETGTRVVLRLPVRNEFEE